MRSYLLSLILQYLRVGVTGFLQFTRNMQQNPLAPPEFQIRLVYSQFLSLYLFISSCMASLL